MANPLFSTPEAPAEETTPVLEVVEHKPAPETGKTQPQPEPNIFDSWLDDTEDPSELIDRPKPAPEPAPTDEPEAEPNPTETPEEVGLDAESLDVLSEAIVQSNDEAAKWLINFLNGPEAEKFPGAQPKQLATIQKAWKGILLRFKYKPSGWDALMAAEFAAYGWHLVGAFLSFISRWIQGLVVWPWQKVRKMVARKPAEPAPAKTVESEGVVLKASDFTGKKEEENSAKDTEAVSGVGELKICLQTNKPFRGAGYPKNSKKHPQLNGKFINKAAFTAYCNTHDLKGPNSRKE